MPKHHTSEPRLQAELIHNSIIYTGKVLNESETGLEVLITDQAAERVLIQGAIVGCSVLRNSRTEVAEALVVRSAHSHVWLRVPSGWMQQERRAFRRRIGGFPVFCTVAGFRTESLCLDVAPGGLRLISSHSPAVMSRLDVEFVLPDLHNSAVRAEAMVLYSLPCDSAHGAIEFGLKFSRLAPADGLRLAQFCAGDHQDEVRQCA